MKQKTEQETNAENTHSQPPETAAGTYIKRRTLTTGETFTGTINSVKYEEETNTLHLHTRFNQLPIRLSLSLDSPSHNTQKLLTTLFVNNNNIDTAHPLNQDIQIRFDADLQTCYHVTSDCELDFTETDPNTTETHTQSQDITNVITSALLKSKYADPDAQLNKTHPGIKLPITKIENKTETFTVTVTPTPGTELTWTIKIPSLTEMQTSPESVFIENQGGGDPRHIDTGGNAVILHTSDTPQEIDTVGTNTNTDWNLIPPTIYNDWYNKHSNTNNPPQPTDPSTQHQTTQNTTHQSTGTSPAKTAMRRGTTPWANKTSYFATTKDTVTNSVTNPTPFLTN